MGTSPKQTKTAETEQQPPSSSFDWRSAGVSGFEDVSQADLGIPFLTIVQKGSPEFDTTHKDYANKKIDGVKPGAIINTLTRVILNLTGPAIFIPCRYERLFVEWKPRNMGGGFVRQHPDESILLQAKRSPDPKDNRDYLPNGNVIVTTMYFFGVLPGYYNSETEEFERAVIGLTSTQLKKGRAWLNMAMSLKLPAPDGSKFTPPLFSHNYALTTVPESNAEGSWFGWHVETAGQVSDTKLIETAIKAAKLPSPTRKMISNADVPI